VGTSKQAGEGDRMSTISLLGCSTSVASATGPTDDEEEKNTRFRRKTKSGLWACAITFQLASTLLEGTGKSISQNSITVLYAKTLSATAKPAVVSPVHPPRPQQTTDQQQFHPKNQMSGAKLLHPAGAALKKSHIKAFSKDGQTHKSTPH